MLLLYEYRTKNKNSCITYYELCLNEVFTSAMWSYTHTVYLARLIDHEETWKYKYTNWCYVHLDV